MYSKDGRKDARRIDTDSYSKLYKWKTFTCFNEVVLTIWNTEILQTCSSPCNTLNHYMVVFSTLLFLWYSPTTNEVDDTAGGDMFPTVTLALQLECTKLRNCLDMD